MDQSIINQSNFYSANIPGKASLSRATAKSVFNTKIEETVPWHQQATGSDGIYRGKAKSKRCVFRYFLKVATELAKRTDCGRLFQRGRAQEWKALAPVSVLTIGTNKLLSINQSIKFQIDFISGHAICHHLYADNRQLYVSFASGDSTEALNGLKSCLACFSFNRCWWMNWNWTQIKLNSSLLGTLFIFPIACFSVKTKPAKSVRNLRAIVSPFAHLYQHSVTHFKKQDLPYTIIWTNLLATAPAFSRLDYCNSFSYVFIADIYLTRLHYRVH